MSAKAWVQLALQELKVSQKELALRIGVSPGQISKWKNDEYMSFDMEARFREITGIREHFPDFILAVGSISESKKWERLITYLADLARESAGTGYDTAPLADEPALLCWQTLSTLTDMGVTIPEHFPSELNALTDDDPEDEAWEQAIESFYAAIIMKIFKSLNDLYGFYAAYVAELVDDDDVLETGMQVESCLMDLAATKIQVDPGKAIKFSRFKYDTIKMYQEWLEEIRTSALRSGRPLRADIFDLIDEGHDALGAEAESESLGFNKNRIHADVYIDELLVGMRAIHQVLPAIIEKLGISDDELNFDPTRLRRSR